MPPGRPTLAIEVKQLKGTSRPDRPQQSAGRSGAVRLLAQIPDPPQDLAASPVAVQTWQLVCETLYEQGRLTPIVLDLVHDYCQELMLKREFTKLAIEEGWVTRYEDENGDLLREQATTYERFRQAARANWLQAMKMLEIDPASEAKRLATAPTEKPLSRIEQIKAKNKK